VNKFSFKDRSKNLKKIKSDFYDIVVVGGGITGAGVAREASLRGFKVCLVEKSDFSTGASSKSSKLAHGGLRYLENFEFDLVAEALNERQHLLRMATHMVRPLSFLVPIYKGDRVGWWKMKAGMLLYDLLCAFRAPKLHTSLNPKKVESSNSNLKTEGLKGGFVYYDAYMDDDRLVVETLRSVSDKIDVASYCEVKEVKSSADKKDKAEKDEALKGVELSCYDSIEDEEFKIKAKHLISCVGPWTDTFGKIIDDSWKDKMRPSKGIHLCVKKSLLGLETAMVMAADKSKRILFCIPRKDFDIVGTTDTDYNEDLDTVRSNDDDVSYVKKVLSEYFPKIDIKDGDILSTYAGVRPLIHDGSSNESKVSRNHRVFNVDEKPITFISGGKYTTYLSMAIHAVDKAVNSNKKLLSSAENIKAKRRKLFVGINTKENQKLALVKIKSLNLDWSTDSINDFVDNHGAQSYSFITENLDKTYLQTEASVAIEHYCCGHLLDFYERRTSWSLSRRFTDEKNIKEVGLEFKNQLGWSENFLNQEIENLQAFLRS